MHKLSLLVTAGLLPAQSPWLEDVGRDHLPVFGEQALVMAHVDADLDGDRDILIAGATRTALWLNDGFGAFTAAPAGWLPTFSGTRAVDVAVGDVDGNGVEDVIWSRASGQSQLWIATGTGYVDATAVRLPTLPVDAGLALLDVDGDSDLDLVASGTPRGATPGLAWYRNDGAGSFSLGAPMTASGVAFYDLAVLDADGDGDLDLVTAAHSAAPTLHLNDGAGSFSVAPLPASGTARTVAAGDVDGDGDPDLVIGTIGPAGEALQDLIWINAGGGSFADATARQLPARLSATVQLELVDIDGDGDLDVITCDEVPAFLDDRTLHALANDGAGFFFDASGVFDPAAFQASAFVALDADRDGDPEIAASGRIHGDHLFWNFSGAFVDAGPRRLVPTRGTPEDATQLDLDGDGDLDLVAAGWRGTFLTPYVRFLENLGGGQFEDMTGVRPAHFGGYSGVAAGDVDGDGDDDLALAVYGGRNRLLRNDGGGQFTDVSAQLPATPLSYSGIDLADLDGDGDLDLVAPQSGTTTVALNNGSGQFTDATALWSPGGPAANGAALGDVDGDGDLDLVLASDGANALWLNDNGQRFVDASGNLPASAQRSREVVLADMDGDGDLDLLVANAISGGAAAASEILWNDGAGRFAVHPAPLAVANAYAVAALDVDHDGDLDAVFGTWDQATVWVENLGGTFALATALGTSGRRATALLAGDFDGDGDADLYEGATDSDHLLMNTYRQLDSTRLAISGGALRLAVSCRPLPNGPNIALVVVGQPVAVASPSPFGPIWLDLPTMTLRALAPLVAGEATVPIPLPLSPSIVGLEFGFQALCMHGANPTTWRTTGAVRETVLR